MFDSAAVTVLAHDSNMLARQVLNHGGGAPVPRHLAFAKVTNNTLFRVVQSEMLPNFGGLCSTRSFRFSHV